MQPSIDGAAAEELGSASPALPSILCSLSDLHHLLLLLQVVLSQLLFLPPQLLLFPMMVAASSI